MGENLENGDNSYLNDDNVFLEGLEPTEVNEKGEIINNDNNHKAEEPSKEEKEKQEKETNFIKHIESIESLFNDGVEDEDSKIKFDDIIRTGKKEDGTEISLDERKEIIQKTFLDKTQLGANEKVDKYVREIISKSFDENFDLDAIIAPQRNDKSEDGINWDDRDGVIRKAYKESINEGLDDKDKLTDEEVAEHISKMSETEKKLAFANIKKNYMALQEEQNKTALLEQEQKFIERVNDYNKQTELSVNTFIEKMKGKDVFSGFKFSEADKNEMLQDMPNFLKREFKDSKEGKFAISQAEELLATLIKDGQSMLELVPFLWMKSKGKLDGYSSFLSEKVKMDLLSRMDENPSAVSQGKTKGDDNFDIFDDSNEFIS